MSRRVSSKLRWLPALLLALMLTATCTISREGFGVSAPRMHVSPLYICPGDPVTITWDVAIPTVDCPDTGTIGDLTCESSYSIYVYSSPPELLEADPVDSNERMGTRVVNPTENVTIRFDALVGTTALYPEFYDVKVVRTDRFENRLESFLWSCNRAGWSEVTYAPGELASENVHIRFVRNTSSFRILLTLRREGGTFIQEELPPGGTSDAFAGQYDGTFNAQIAPSEIGRFPVPICEPTFQQDGYPNIEIEVTMECVADTPAGP